MKRILLLYFFLASNAALSQKIKSTILNNGFKPTGKYLCFNPLGLLEPQITIGFGAGTRITPRSEFFTEVAYLGRNPVYKYDELKFYHGVRLLMQYRYHFLQQWRPIINLGRFTEYQRERRRRNQFFMGVEFRIKPVNFSAYNNFENKTTAATLDKFQYKANSLSLGGAILFGETYRLSKNENWLLELTAGIGAKQKSVKYKNIPAGYSVIPRVIREMDFIPRVDEPAGMPYLPATIRLRYLIR